MVTITVTPSGTDENTLEPVIYYLDHPPMTPEEDNIDEAVVRVNQEQKAHLRAEIDSPEDQAALSVCEYFLVEVTVYNDGEAAALNCTATIDIVGPAVRICPDATWDTTPTTIPGLYPWDTGIPGSATVSWELKCTDYGEVTITVTPAGIDENTGRPIIEDNLESDSITVKQAYTIDLWGPKWDPTINPDGWNQISLMVRPLETDIRDVLDGIKEEVVVVWYYDASVEDWSGETDPDSWLSMTPTYDEVNDIWSWDGDLFTMEDGKGYWIQVRHNCTLAIIGEPVAPPEVGPHTPTSYRVYKGWNLVGFSSPESMYLHEYFFTLYLNDILKKVAWWGSGPWYQWWLMDDMVYDHNIGAVLMPSTALLPSNIYLMPGQGYWIWVAEDSEIVVPWMETGWEDAPQP
jgi:hypothetical protein